MSNVAKLKKRALEYEQKKQFDKALETYMQLLSQLDDHVEEADVALFNRVGDLLLRNGDVSAAVDQYERAVDLYAEGGFFNNAIALCNKILRNAPGRDSVYYKLGKISARKGFISDAKQNFLEYADRMQRMGNLEQAFSALKEFADLCPDQEDIRLMLADQLARKDRREEAIEQLQHLYEKFQAEGRTREARATVDRMNAIEPGFTPAPATERAVAKPRELIFLEVDYDAPAGSATRGTATPASRSRSALPALPVSPRPPQAPPTSPDLAFIEGAPFIEVPPLPDVAASEEEVASLHAPPADDARVEGLVHGADLAASSDEGETGLTSHLDLGFITGFETAGSADTAEPDATARTDIEPLADVEPTSLDALGGDADVLEFELQEDPGTGLLAESLPAAPADSDVIDLLPPPVESPDESAVAMPRMEHTYEVEALADPLVEATPVAREPVLDEEPPLDEEAPLEVPAEAQEQDQVAPPPDVPAVPLVERLRSEIERVPDNWDLHRLFGEALLEHGDREGGLAQFEVALLGYERDGDLRAASGIAEELVRVQPNSVRFHQKRVEYAVRANERPRLVAAYLALADCLLRDGEVNKSRAVYHRVLELAPDDVRARSALRSVGTGDTPVPAAPRMSAPTGVPRRESSPTPAPAPSRAASHTPPPDAPADGYVNLSDWLREDEPERNTRMVADVSEPRDQEQADFAEMLEMFKRGVARNVDESDFESHYDLGVAYKEMGLLDEAITEFQKALRGNDQRVRTYEALGQCFTEKGQYQIALTLLARALNDRTASDDTLVGVLYLLGIASEALGRWPDAQRFYERVFAVDIQFRDVAERLAAIERHAR